MITKCNLLSLVPSEATFHPTPPLQKRKLMWQCQTIIIQLNKVRLLISWVFFFIRDILHYAMDQGAYDVVLLNTSSNLPVRSGII